MTVELEDATKELQSLAGMHPELNVAIRDLQELHSFCALFGVRRSIMCYPLLSVNNHLHCITKNAAIFFQTTVFGRTKPQTVAVGGRYDSLIQHFTPSDRRSTARLTGVSIAVGQLAKAVELEQGDSSRVNMMSKAEEERSYGRYAARRCDVYIASFGAGLLEQRLLVLKMLWEAGICADVQYEGDSASPEQMLSRRRHENVLYLVLVKHHQGREPFYKVRAVLKTGEEEGRSSTPAVIGYLSMSFFQCRNQTW